MHIEINPRSLYCEILFLRKKIKCVMYYMGVLFFFKD